MRLQLAGTWLIGSVVPGTIAVLLTHDRGDLPFRPLLMLSGLEVLALLLLGVTLFLALFALGWRTIDASWLPDQPRAVVLWACLVGGAGLGGWAFAAAITLAADFSLVAQLILAYTAGGLPFTLLAAMLARPPRLNIAAAVLAAVAVLTGLAMIELPLWTLVQYLNLLAAPVTGR
ncbi:hypothetical protein [Actinophytocola sp.]|uniref:hypothetical protein n=1 Tax=Actinophytocola sp. TaxID=1872138 RepID=UPI002ED0D104